MNSYQLLASLALLCATSSGNGQTVSLACGSVENTYGPFDYRATDAPRRALVEKFHFTPKVETLKGGSTASTPGGDLQYTLGVFPNHPRALMATVKFAERTKRDPPPEMNLTVICWFDRAERFTPNDATVKMLYGMYLVRAGKLRKEFQNSNRLLNCRRIIRTSYTIWGLHISTSRISTSRSIWPIERIRWGFLYRV